jgi:hypothetical protein
MGGPNSGVRGPRKPRSKAEDPQIVTLDDLVEQGRWRYKNVDTKALDAALKLEHAQDAVCSHRWQWKDRRASQRRIKDLQRQRDFVTSGGPMRKYLREVNRTRNAIAMAQRKQPMMMSSSGKLARAKYMTMDQIFKDAGPLLKKSPASKSTIVRSTPSSMQDVYRLILDEFEHRVNGKPLPTYVNPIDICTRCNQQMTVNVIENVLVCPTPGCRVKRQADASHVAAMQHVPVADVVDYNNGRDTGSVGDRTEQVIQRTQGLEAGSHPREKIFALAQCMYRHRAVGIEQYAEHYRKAYEAGGPFQSLPDALLRLPADIAEDTYRKIVAFSGHDIVHWFKVLRQEQPGTKATKGNKGDTHAHKTNAQLLGMQPRRFLPFMMQRIRQLIQVSKYQYQRNKPIKASSLTGGHMLFVRSLLTLHGWDEFLPDYPAPKPQTVREHEPLRQKIFEALQWEFIPMLRRPPPLTLMPAPSAPEPSAADNDSQQEVQITKNKTATAAENRTAKRRREDARRVKRQRIEDSAAEK